VGCGTGLSHKGLKDVIGIDPSLEMIKQTPNGIQGKAESLPFPDHSFDTIISMTAIHNFDDPEQAIREMKRVGKRNFIITILKKSSKLSNISELINKSFTIRKTIDENKDIIYICE
ncbi:MAG: class I SAM-dependent methyltransferase, partial [Nanoarchaeota archaeon]